jgi:uncharacterized protein YabE (DUF348 family)
MKRFSLEQPNARESHSERIRRWKAHPFGVPIFVFLGLILLSAVILAILSLTHTTATFRPSNNYIAIVSHDGVKQTVPTRPQTVSELLQKLNVKLSSRDRVEPSANTMILQDNFRINVYRAYPATIFDGKTRTTTYTAAATPRASVAETGMTLYSDDDVSARPVDNFVAQQSVGQEIFIDRSFPVVLNVYGTKLFIRTHEDTVGQLLKSKNVKLGEKDSVVPSLDTPLDQHTQIFVVRKGTQIVTETQTIPTPVETVTDPNLSFGTTAVRQQGTPGTQVLTYQVQTENGKEIGRTLIQTIITAQPVTQIIARGQAVSIPADKQAVMAQAGVSPGDYPYVDYIASHEGGWCPTKVQGQYGACPGYPPNPIPSYGGYGIFQATPGGKMASAGADWQTSAVTQIRWATGYAVGRYGSWGAAYNYWTVHHNW